MSQKGNQKTGRGDVGRRVETCERMEGMYGAKRSVTGKVYGTPFG
jgi:hypothetical protein